MENSIMSLDEVFAMQERLIKQLELDVSIYEKLLKSGGYDEAMNLRIEKQIVNNKNSIESLKADLIKHGK